MNLEKIQELNWTNARRLASKLPWIVSAYTEILDSSEIIGELLILPNCSVLKDGRARCKINSKPHSKEERIIRAILCEEGGSKAEIENPRLNLSIAHKLYPKQPGQCEFYELNGASLFIKRYDFLEGQILLEKEKNYAEESAGRYRKAILVSNEESIKQAIEMQINWLNSLTSRKLKLEGRLQTTIADEIISSIKRRRETYLHREGSRSFNYSPKPICAIPEYLCHRMPAFYTI